MRGIVKPAIIEQLRDENKSGGLGKSSMEVSVFPVEEDEGRREGLGLWSKCSGFCRVRSCAAGGAGRQEEAAATCVVAGPRLSAMAIGVMVMVLEGSVVAVMGDTRVEEEGAGGS